MSRMSKEAGAGDFLCLPSSGRERGKVSLGRGDRRFVCWNDVLYHPLCVAVGF